MDGLTDDLAARAQSALGLAAFLAIAWALSSDRRRFPAAAAAATLAFQLAVAALFLHQRHMRQALGSLTAIVEALQAATGAGTQFVFGYLGGGETPFAPREGASAFSLAFEGLPLVIFVSGLAALLWRWRILKWIITGLAVLLQRAFNVGGTVALAAAANMFLGPTEAPLLIRPYLDKVSRAELFMIISAGFATVAGTVMALYAVILQPVAPAVLGHVIVASILSVPAAVLLAQIMEPEEAGRTPTPAGAADAFNYRSSMDAFVRGVGEGMTLYLNIIAALIAFVAFTALVDIILAAGPDVAGGPVTVERVLGLLFAPLMWLTGVSPSECIEAGRLMGVKTAVNEVVAYVRLAEAPAEAFSNRTRMILIYAICGFANFASLGIVVSGLSGLAPARRADILALAPRALIAGTLATLSTGAAVGVVWSAP